MSGDQTPSAGSIFSLGWLMARLFGRLEEQPDTETWTHLPALSELGTNDYVGLALAELDDLLAQAPGGLSDAAVRAAWQADGHAGFTDEVGKLHLAIMGALAGDRPQLSAYQLGRALSDLCSLPGQLASKADGGAFVLAEFGRQPMAALQTWLAEASASLPEQSAATVSRSLQNWQDWADINADVVQHSWTSTPSPASAAVVQALRAQGSVWYALLSGETDMDGQLSVDAWIQAGQSIAKTTGHLVRTILRRFWPALVIVAAATAGLLFLAIDKSAGTAKVWTSLVTVAAAFGITGASLRTAANTAASGLEKDVEDTAKLDARAWSATWLPALQQSPAKRRRLARRGVSAPRSGLNLEGTAPPALEPRISKSLVPPPQQATTPSSAAGPAEPAPASQQVPAP